MNKAQRLDSEEWVEGYYIEESGGEHYIIRPNIIQWKKFEIKPSTLQVQITSTGEWVNVDDTEVVGKADLEGLRKFNKIFEE